MALYKILRFGENIHFKCVIPSRSIICRIYSQESTNVDTEEFRVLELVPNRNKERTAKRKAKQVEVPPPRYTKMTVDQDWPSVWPGPRSFHPASVPIPIWQGYVAKGVSPGKFANAELMKIPNFLHLTPPAIKKHCEALKKFCTPWPEGLETDEKCDEHFPLNVISSDYCHSAPTIREPLARIVTIQVNLNSIPLDSHAKDKLLRLVGERYNPDTNILTIAADRCPLKKQNYEYAMYLLTAVVHESWKIEPWEKEKSEADMEYYRWETNASKDAFIRYHCWPEEPSDKPVEEYPHYQEYKDAVEDLMNKGEDMYTLSRYKEATKKLFGLPQNPLVENAE